MIVNNEQRNFYVYAYYSAQSKLPIYIGKGTKNRCLAHLDRFQNEKNIKVCIIKENLTEEEAYLIESACIDVVGVDNLKYNKFKGKHSTKHIAKQLIEEDDLNIDDVPNKSLIIYLGKIEDGHDVNMMNDFELYERARSCWKMSKVKGGYAKVNEYKYVFVGYKKHIIAVYKNIHWFKAGQTQLFTRENIIRPDRYEFVGRIDNKLNKKFVGKYYYNKQFDFGGGLYTLKK